jgi:hypothetical protein
MRGDGPGVEAGAVCLEKGGKTMSAPSDASLRRYVDAKAAFDSASQHVKHLGHQFEQAGKFLKDLSPSSLVLRGRRVDLVGYGSTNVTVLNEESWPSWASLEGWLTEYIEAAQELKEATEALSDSDKKTLGLRAP